MEAFAGDVEEDYFGRNTSRQFLFQGFLRDTVRLNKAPSFLQNYIKKKSTFLLDTPSINPISSHSSRIFPNFFAFYIKKIHFLSLSLSLSWKIKRKKTGEKNTNFLGFQLWWKRNVIDFSTSRSIIGLDSSLLN